MKPNLLVRICLTRSRNCLTLIGLATACMLFGCTPVANAQQCSFTSPSDGSDGDYDLTGASTTQPVYFRASDFHGTGVANNIFNFRKIIIPIGVTVKFSEKVFHGPVYWLATNDVTIAGILDLSGEDAYLGGSDPTLHKPSAGGSGGYPGGVGGGGAQGFTATPGGGPGGGAVGMNVAGGTAAIGISGSFVGTNDYLVPLIGGSGGGGSYNPGGTAFGTSGSGGGGAIQIASSGSVTVSGGITVAGGNGGDCASGGSGGAILIKASSITGGGYMNQRGGAAACSNPGSAPPGLIRLETCNYSLADRFNGVLPLISTPTKLFLPDSPSPQVQVTSVNGMPIIANPFFFPDIQIKTASPIPVVITAHQVPLGTVPTLYISSESGDRQLQCTDGLKGTLSTSTCTLPVTFPFGGSLGFVKATWTQ